MYRGNKMLSDEKEFNKRFVGIVKKHECLYNGQKVSQNALNSAWSEVKEEASNVATEIGIELHITVPYLRKRWRNLRDTFKKDIDKSSRKKDGKLCKPYYLYEDMKFLLSLEISKSFNSEDCEDSDMQELIPYNDDSLPPLNELPATSKSKREILVNISSTPMKSKDAISRQSDHELSANMRVQDKSNNRSEESPLSLVRPILGHSEEFNKGSSRTVFTEEENTGIQTKEAHDKLHNFTGETLMTMAKPLIGQSKSFTADYSTLMFTLDNKICSEIAEKTDENHEMDDLSLICCKQETVSKTHLQESRISSHQSNESGAESPLMKKHRSDSPLSSIVDVKESHTMSHNFNIVNHHQYSESEPDDDEQSSALTDSQKSSAEHYKSTRGINNVKRPSESPKKRRAFLPCNSTKRKRRDAENPHRLYLESLYYDIKQMSDTQLRQFKSKVSDIVVEILDKPQ